MRGLDLVVERHLRFLDGVARQQAHAQQIDRDADRDVVDEGERKSAQHDVPVGHAEEFRHQEGADPHHRRHDQPAHRGRGLDRGGKGAGDAVAHHQRNRDGADHGGVGRAAAADHSDRARSHHRGLRDQLPRPAGDQPHDVDHRALRVEAVGDAGQQQEGGDQGERELAVEAVDAGRELDRARGHDAVEGRAGMPEEVDRAEISPERVDDEDDVGPEQDRMGEPRQLHHQQEHQQPDDEILLRVGALRIDRDPLELEIEIDEGIDADADIDRDQRVVGDRRQPFVEIVRPGT